MLYVHIKFQFSEMLLFLFQSQTSLFDKVLLSLEVSSSSTYIANLRKFVWKLSRLSSLSYCCLVRN